MTTNFEIDFIFNLRVFYAIELFLCSAVLIFIRTFFKQPTIRRILMRHSLWFLCLASTRLATTLIDFFLGTGLGSYTLFFNDLFWAYVCIYLFKFALRLYRNAHFRESVIYRTENAFDEIETRIKQNTNKIDAAIRQR